MAYRGRRRTPKYVSKELEDMKHLAQALKLHSKIETVDRFAQSWYGKDWRHKRPQDLEEDEKREWYDISDSWNRAVKELTRAISTFREETGYSPILRYYRSADRQGVLGKIFLGYDSSRGAYVGEGGPRAIVRGYRIIEIAGQKQEDLAWWEDLDLPTEDMSEEDVFKLTPAVMRTSEQQINSLREDFIKDLREAGIAATQAYLNRFDDVVSMAVSYNENIDRVDVITQAILREHALAVPIAPGPLAMPTVPIVMPKFSIQAQWGKSPRGLDAVWAAVYQDGQIRIRGHREIPSNLNRDELENLVADYLGSTLREAGLDPEGFTAEIFELTETLMNTVPKSVIPPEVEASDVLLALEGTGLNIGAKSMQQLTEELRLKGLDVATQDGKFRLGTILTTLVKEGILFEPRLSLFAKTSARAEVKPSEEAKEVPLDKAVADAIRELEGL